MSDSTYLYQSVSVSPTLETVPWTSSHSILQLPSTSLSLHNTSWSVSSIVLDVQHFLKTIPSSFWWHPHWLHNIYKLLGLWTYLNQWRFTIFSIDGAKNFKYMCSGLLCCVCGLFSLSSGLLLWFLTCGMVQVLFLSSMVKF